jgi:hypothetical protein
MPINRLYRAWVARIEQMWPQLLIIAIAYRKRALPVAASDILRR